MDINLPLAIALGAALGLIFSALGAGGGVLAVPVLLFIFHLPLPAATGTSLAIVCATAVVAGFFHWRAGNVDWRVVLSFAIPSMLTAPLGGLLHPHVPQTVTLLLFGAVLLIVGARMWRQPQEGDARGTFKLAPAIALAAVIGCFTGLLGIGGGFLIVPALTTLLGVPTRIAIGSSAAIICACSLTGALTYAADGSVHTGVMFSVGAGALVGAALGVPLSKKLPELVLRRAFAVVALGVCARMVVEAVRR